MFEALRALNRARRQTAPTDWVRTLARQAVATRGRPLNGFLSAGSREPADRRCPIQRTCGTHTTVPTCGGRITARSVIPFSPARSDSHRFRPRIRAARHRVDCGNGSRFNHRRSCRARRDRQAGIDRHAGHPVSSEKGSSLSESKVGTYRISAELAGFRKSVQTGIVLHVQRESRSTSGSSSALTEDVRRAR